MKDVKILYLGLCTKAFVSITLCKVIINGSPNEVQFDISQDGIFVICVVQIIMNLLNFEQKLV